jgi:hypothetical protein
LLDGQRTAGTAGHGQGRSRFGPKDARQKKLRYHSFISSWPRPETWFPQWGAAPKKQADDGHHGREQTVCVGGLDPPKVTGWRVIEGLQDLLGCWTNAQGRDIVHGEIFTSFLGFWLDEGARPAWQLGEGRWGIPRGNPALHLPACTLDLAPCCRLKTGVSRHEHCICRRISITGARFSCLISRKFDYATLFQACTSWRLDILQLGFQPRFCGDVR